MSILKPLSALAITSCFLIATTASVQAGSLKGKNGHTASGNASRSGNMVKLANNFKFDGGPDVYVAVKKRGQKLKLLAKLRKNRGAQSYRLTSGSKNADTVVLWCKKYGVSLGEATLD